jgi:glucokinase
VDAVLAVDIGGTKLAAAIVTPDGELRARRTVPTSVPGDPGEPGDAGDPGPGDALFARVAAMVDQVLGDGDAAGLRPVVCGVGCGGPMTPGGDEVSPLNIAPWRDFPLRGRLADHTGLPTFVDNDAKALALGEGWRGAAAGVHDYIGMVVSTGVGGGIVLGGRLLDGAGGNAGHIGHVIVVPGGRTCSCGANGCVEAEASGTAIAAITGRPAAEAGPEIVARTGRLVGLAVGTVANLLDLRLAVVAGSVALGYGAPFFAAAQAEVNATCRLSFSRGAVVRPAGLGDLGPLVGAAAVGWRGIGRHVDIG